jgi:hypothetical protein
MNPRTVAFALFVGAAMGADAGMAAAQTLRGGWIVEVPDAVTPTHRFARIHVLAWFDYIPNQAELFADARFSLTTSEPEIYEGTGICPLGMGGQCSPFMRYEPGGQVVSRVDVGQIHFPPGVPGNPSNPVLVFHVEWETNDFTPRRVAVTLDTTRFRVYKSMNSPELQDVPLTNVTGGAGVIEVGCLPDCDTSTGYGALDVFDFLCFQNEFAAGTPYACDFDTTTGRMVCDIFDFLGFQNAFANGCP